MIRIYKIIRFYFFFSRTVLDGRNSSLQFKCDRSACLITRIGFLSRIILCVKRGGGGLYGTSHTGILAIIGTTVHVPPNRGIGYVQRERHRGSPSTRTAGGRTREPPCERNHRQVHRMMTRIYGARACI